MTEISGQKYEPGPVRLIGYFYSDISVETPALLLLLT